LNNAGNTDLIDHLAQLAGSGPAEQGDCLGKCKHDWPGLFKRLFFTATHNGKHAVLCACLPAGNRRIDTVNILYAAFVVQFARDLCRSSSVVDIQAAGFHAAKGSLRSEHDAAKVVIVAHTAED